MRDGEWQDYVSQPAVAIRMLFSGIPLAFLAGERGRSTKAEEHRR